MYWTRATALLISTTFIGVAAINASSWAQDTDNHPTLGEVVRLDPALDAILPRDAKIEVLASGFDFSEGPVWYREGQEDFLVFSDIPRNQLMQWRPGVGASLFLKPSGYTGRPRDDMQGSNGLTLDLAGRLVSCEHGDRRVSVLERGGGKLTLVARYQGKRLNSPNDAIYHSSGALYFTDPPYGLPQGSEDPRRELDFCGVYRLDSSGELTLLTKEMTFPNGIGFSPDERTLYVAQSDRNAAIWRAFDVQPDGSVTNSRVLYDSTPLIGKHRGVPDGMAVDAQGNIFGTGPGGVLIISPQGKLLGRIDTFEQTANCCFGGDGSELFITADMYLCRVKTSTKGVGW